MTEELLLRRAMLGDLGVVLDLLAQGASFALARGIDQWPERFPPQFILAGIERDEVLVASIDGMAVGTMSLALSDPVVWGPDDGQAGYVHRLAVSTERRGTGLGGRLLDRAQDQVIRAQRSLLRLDCLARNSELRRWSETVGFVHQGDRDVPGPRGAPVAISLYQRPMRADPIP